MYMHMLYTRHKKKIKTFVSFWLIFQYRKKKRNLIAYRSPGMWAGCILFLASGHGMAESTHQSKCSINSRRD